MPGLPDDVEITLGGDGPGTTDTSTAGLTSRRQRWGIPDLNLSTYLLWLLFVINLGVFYALQTWLPAILERQGLMLASVVAVTTLATVGGILCSVLAGLTMDRFGPYPTLITLYVAGALCVAMTGTLLGQAAVVLMAANFLIGVAVNGSQKSIIALANMQYQGQIRAGGVGWCLGIGRIGAVLGPAVLGLALGAKASAVTIFIGFGALLLVAAGAVEIMRRLAGRRSEGAPQQVTASTRADAGDVR